MAIKDFTFKNMINPQPAPVPQAVPQPDPPVELNPSEIAEAQMIYQRPEKTVNGMPPPLPKKVEGWGRT
jgi:hypothetical protein